MLTVENEKLIWACEPKNYTGAAATAKYVSLKGYHRITIIIQTGAWAGGTAAVTINQATDVSATGAKALAFTKYWTDDALAGTLVETACASTFNLDTANSLYVIEVDASTLDLANLFDCLTVAIASPGANNDFYGVVYALTEPRYAQATPPSPLVD